MNAIALARPGIDAFHRERSRFMDAFAECEGSAATLASALGVKCGAEPFGQKVVALGAVPAKPTYAKAHKTKVDAALAELLDILPIRADIVHSPLRVAEVDGATMACFVNARQHGSPCPNVRLISFENFRALTRKVAKIAEDLRLPCQISPASSPLQPSPVAAVGP